MKNRFSLLTLLLAIMIINSLQAQTPKLDSLREVLNRDTSNFDVLRQLTGSLADINTPEAMVYAKRLKLIAMAQGDTFRIVSSARLVGQLHNRQSDVNLAIKELAPILAIAERHNFKDEIKKILNSLAISFNNMGEYDRALDYHLKSLTLKEEDKDSAGVAVSLNNIGIVYHKLENPTRALHYWKKCLELKLKTNDKYDLDALYLNLALCYQELGDNRKSQENLEKIFAECGVNCTKRILIHSQFAMGELALRTHKFKEAKDHLRKSLSLSQDNNDLEFQLENLLALSEVAFAEKDLVTVRSYLDGIAALSGIDQFIQSQQTFYRLSSNYYFLTRNFRLANDFERKYSHLTDIINSSEMHRRLMEIQINFIESENRKKLESQQVLVKAQAKIIENRNLISFLLFGIAVLTIILLIVFFKLNVKKTAINKRLDELVRERTFELESSRNELVHAYDEQKLVLHKISSNLMSSLATISGLVNVGSLENFEDAPTYIKAAEQTLTKLVESVNWLDRDPEKYSM